MAKNIEHVFFLRNGNVYNNRTAALEALENNKSRVGDGEFILARYTNTVGTIVTIAGIKHEISNSSGLTFVDIEGASADVNALRQEINAKLGEGITSSNTATAQLTALSGTSADGSGVTSVWGAKAYAKDYTDEQIVKLDYTDTAVNGEYVSQVSQADGKISVTRVALPDASSVANENKIVTDVTQSKGKITATASNITGVKLAGYAEGTDADIAATDTLGEALGKLQAQINAMDKDASAVAGQVVTTVTEVDGKVTETKANVKDLQLGGYQLDNSTGPIASADTINVALSKLENKAAAITIENADGSINVTTGASGTDINVKIKSGEKVIRKDGGAGIWTDIAISAVTGTELTNLGTNVKEAYKLVDSYGGKLGEYVKIYKDSALVDFFLGHVDDLLSGTTAQTEESESSTVVPGIGDTALVYVMQLANGNYKLTAVDVEAFIEEAEFASGVTWDNEAHKVKGVVDPDSEEDESNVAFLTVGADGFKVSGIKDAIDTKINKLDADLSGNTSHVKVGVKEVDGKITSVTVAEIDIANASDLSTLSGKSVTQVAMTGGTVGIVASDNPADGTKKITIITDGSQIKMTGYAKGSASGAVDATDSVNAAISKLENQIAGKVDALDATVSGQTTDGKVKVQVVQENGVLTAVTVTGTNIASASDLSTLSGKTVTGITVNNKAVTVSNNVAPISISAATSSLTASTNNAIVVNTDNNGNITLGLNYIDCGTY